ncbi:MAG TPA: OsmC family peroxiredoxin, partial [Alphaproteobacteria bacterium]|nr:OsmC family peroxiredoxin [Alphaproteobacteria bacterium]
MPERGEHLYSGTLLWTGADAGPTSSYQSYSRAWRMEFAGKPALEGSADSTFRGDAAKLNPEELLLAA